MISKRRLGKMNVSWSLLEENNPPDNWEDSGKYLNIAHIVEITQSDGPGKRFEIWVQGCPIRCRGCWNSELWPFEPKHIVSVDKLAEYILQYSDIVDGITVSGGEPLYQAKALEKLINILREKSDLTVMVYTGYYKDQIPDEHGKNIFEMADVVVSGPYVESERDLSLLWRGSRNQKIVFHNERYRKIYEEEGEKNAMEIHINDEKVEIVGFPDDSILEEVKKW